MVLPELVDAPEPLGVSLRLDNLVQLLQHPGQVTHNRHVGVDVLVDFRRVYVHVNHLGVGSEGADLAGDAVVKAHPKADYQVRLVDCQAGVGDAVHPGHAHEERVVVREGAAAQQGGDYRNLGLLGKLPQLVVAPGDDDAVARQNHGPLGLGDELRRPLDLGGMAIHDGLVARQVDAVRVVEVGRLREHVLGDVHQDRAGPAGVGDVEGFLDGLSNLACVHHQVVVLGDGQGNAGYVRLLECVPTDGRP